MKLTDGFRYAAVVATSFRFVVFHFSRYCHRFDGRRLHSVPHGGCLNEHNAPARCVTRAQPTRTI